MAEILHISLLSNKEQSCVCHHGNVNGAPLTNREMYAVPLCSNELFVVRCKWRMGCLLQKRQENAIVVPHSAFCYSFIRSLKIQKLFFFFELISFSNIYGRQLKMVIIELVSKSTEEIVLIRVLCFYRHHIPTYLKQKWCVFVHGWIFEEWAAVATLWNYLERFFLFYF